MTKYEQRKMISSLAFSNVSDEQALNFIKNLVYEQMYKSPKSLELFCIDCGIFYTSHPYLMLLHKEDYDAWSEEFIRKCSYFELVVRGERADVRT